MNDGFHVERPPFVLVGDYESSFVRCFWVKTMCSSCRDCFHLCPPRENLETNLKNHLGGARHAKVVEKNLATKGAGITLMTIKRGRPSKSSSNNVASNKKSIHDRFQHTTNKEEEGEFRSWDRSCFLSFVCWGFRGPHALYGEKRYEVSSMLFDPHPGHNWYPKPYVRSSFISDGGIVRGERYPFVLSNVFVTLVPSTLGLIKLAQCALRFPSRETFAVGQCVRTTVLRKEELGVVKGRQLGYLSHDELAAHSQIIKKKLKLGSFYHWATRVRIM